MSKKHNNKSSQSAAGKSQQSAKPAASQSSVKANASSANHSTRAKSADRQQLESKLDQQLGRRPTAEELKERHILKDTSVSPMLQSTQGELERLNLESALERKLSARPKPNKLVERHILTKDEVKEIAAPAESHSIKSQHQQSKPTIQQQNSKNSGAQKSSNKVTLYKGGEEQILEKSPQPKKTSSPEVEDVKKGSKSGNSIAKSSATVASKKNSNKKQAQSPSHDPKDMQVILSPMSPKNMQLVLHNDDDYQVIQYSPPQSMMPLDVASKSKGSLKSKKNGNKSQPEKSSTSVSKKQTALPAKNNQVASNKVSPPASLQSKVLSNASKNTLAAATLDPNHMHSISQIARVPSARANKEIQEKNARSQESKSNRTDEHKPQSKQTADAKSRSTSPAAAKSSPQLKEQSHKEIEALKGQQQQLKNEAKGDKSAQNVKHSTQAKSQQIKKADQESDKQSSVSFASLKTAPSPIIAPTKKSIHIKA